MAATAALNRFVLELEESAPSKLQRLQLLCEPLWSLAVRWAQVPLGQVQLSLLQVQLQLHEVLRLQLGRCLSLPLLRPADCATRLSLLNVVIVPHPCCMQA